MRIKELLKIFIFKQNMMRCHPEVVKKKKKNHIYKTKTKEK